MCRQSNCRCAGAGLLFPTFDNRSANIYNALFYSRKEGELHQEFIDAVFHTDLPMSAAEQREAFEAALSESLGSAAVLRLCRQSTVSLPQ
mgnify:CR=1 FL=1